MAVLKKYIFHSFTKVKEILIEAERLLFLWPLFVSLSLWRIRWIYGRGECLRTRVVISIPCANLAKNSFEDSQLVTHHSSTPITSRGRKKKKKISIGQLALTYRTREIIDFPYITARLTKEEPHTAPVRKSVPLHSISAACFFKVRH